MACRVLHSDHAASPRPLQPTCRSFAASPCRLCVLEQLHALNSNDETWWIPCSGIDWAPPIPPHWGAESVARDRGPAALDLAFCMSRRGGRRRPPADTRCQPLPCHCDQQRWTWRRAGYMHGCGLEYDGRLRSARRWIGQLRCKQNRIGTAAIPQCSDWHWSTVTPPWSAAVYTNCNRRARRSGHLHATHNLATGRVGHHTLARFTDPRCGWRRRWSRAD